MAGAARRRRCWRRSPRGVCSHAPDDARVPGRLLAAGAAATLATALLVVFEWRVLSPNAIAPAWALTAVGLVALGLWKRQAALRWHGYAVAVVADGARRRSVARSAAGITAAADAAIAVGHRGGLRGGVSGPPGAVRRARHRRRRPATRRRRATVTRAVDDRRRRRSCCFKWRVLPELHGRAGMGGHRADPRRARHRIARGRASAGRAMRSRRSARSG